VTCNIARRSHWLILALFKILSMSLRGQVGYPKEDFESGSEMMPWNPRYPWLLDEARMSSVTSLEPGWLGAIHTYITRIHKLGHSKVCARNLSYHGLFCTTHIYCYQPRHCKCNIDQVSKMPQPILRDAECNVPVPPRYMSCAALPALRAVFSSEVGLRPAARRASAPLDVNVVLCCASNQACSACARPLDVDPEEPPARPAVGRCVVQI